MSPASIAATVPARPILAFLKERMRAADPAAACRGEPIHG